MGVVVEALLRAVVACARSNELVGGFRRLPVEPELVEGWPDDDAGLVR